MSVPPHLKLTEEGKRLWYSGCPMCRRLLLEKAKPETGKLVCK